jgi:hypothetical protein
MSPPNYASRCAHYLTNADVMGAATAVQLQGVYDLCAPLLPCFLKYVRKISLGKVDQSMAPWADSQSASAAAAPVSASTYHRGAHGCGARPALLLRALGAQLAPHTQARRRTRRRPTTSPRAVARSPTTRAICVTAPAPTPARTTGARAALRRLTSQPPPSIRAQICIWSVEQDGVHTRSVTGACRKECKQKGGCCKVR